VRDCHNSRKLGLAFSCRPHPAGVAPRGDHPSNSGHCIPPCCKRWEWVLDSEGRACGGGELYPAAEVDTYKHLQLVQVIQQLVLHSEARFLMARHLF